MRINSKILTSVVLAASTGFVLSACSGAPMTDSGSSSPVSADCVIADNDLSTDDLMAVPAMMGTLPVVAVVQTEGVSRAPQATSAAEMLVSQSRAESRPIVVLGASPAEPADLSSETWLPSVRAMTERLNGFMAGPLVTGSPSESFTDTLVQATAACTSIDVLITGPFSSFAIYSPVLSSKINRVIMQGVPLRGDPTQKPGKIGFNCAYDLAACEKAFDQLAQYDATWIDIPRDTDAVYSPSADMVAGLFDDGLPGALKAVLQGAPQSWQPDRLTEDDESKLWDQSVALYAAHPDVFTEVGNHLVTTLTPEEFHKQWTSDVNKNLTKQ